MAQPSRPQTSSTTTPSRRERIELELDGALVDASRITREQLERAPPGVVIAWKLAVLSARILRGAPRVSGTVGGGGVITEADESAAVALYRAWSDLAVGQAEYVRSLWRDAKAAYERLVSENNEQADQPSSSVIDAFSDSAAEMVGAVLKKAVKIVETGVGEATVSYYSMKSEAFDWIAGVAILLVAYGWAKR